MQYILKPAYSGAASTFQWHRDGDWIASHDAEDVPYISVWHQYYLKFLQCYADFTYCRLYGDSRKVIVLHNDVTLIARLPYPAGVGSSGRHHTR